MDYATMSIKEAKARLNEVVRQADKIPVVLLRHSEQAAVVLSVERWRSLLNEIEDLRDRLALHRARQTSPDMRISHDKLMAELGLPREDM